LVPWRAFNYVSAILEIDGQVPFGIMDIHETNIEVAVHGREAPSTATGFDCKEDHHPLILLDGVQVSDDLGLRVLHDVNDSPPNA
jgi:hypothetical protein